MSAPKVSPDEARRLMVAEGYAYVDVRSEPEYAAGHPAGAVNVPIAHAKAGGMQPNPRFLDVMKGLFARDAKILVGCKSGGRSARAAEALGGAGFTSVVDSRAGWDGVRDAFGTLTDPGWSHKDLPSETVTEGGSYAEVVKKVG